MRLSPDLAYNGQMKYGGKMIKMSLKKLIRDEAGQVMILVLILLAVGSLIIAPLLTYMGTGLIAGQVHEEMAADFYAADAGVEDGLWQIKYDHLEEKFTSPAYDPYDFDIFGTVYDYPPPLLDVNDRDVAVSIENVWIPKDITPSSKNEARDIIETGKLIIVGGVHETNEYQIKIDYYKGETDNDLEVEELGIWLPPGFHYIEESSSLEDDDQAPYYPSSVEITPHNSGEAVVWNFDPNFLFADLPGVNPMYQPMESIITFQFDGPAGQSPTAVSWIVTDQVPDIPYAWDADNKIYKITSEAFRDISEPPNTTVEAYTSRSEIRKLGSAISGDYCATGNTLMTATGSGGDSYYRDRLFNESSDTIQSINPDEPDYIPEGATVEAAYLYWSGWLEETGAGGTPFVDYCIDFSQWNLGTPSDWHIDYMHGAFYAHHDYNGKRELVMKSTIDLHSYESGTVTASWRQWLYQENIESGDCLQYSFHGGSGWSEWYTAFCDDTEVGTSSETFSVVIPDECLTTSFRMKFQITGFDGYNERVYIDDIKVSITGASPVEDAKVNRVIFNDTQVTADAYQIESTPDSGAPESWCYSCFYDATDLVEQFIDAGDIQPNGSGTYTLGHWTEGSGYDLYPSGSTDYPLATPASCTGYGCGQYQWTYAGWSLIIIYSSPETKGHQLYLFDDDFRYVKVHTTLDFSISGFLVPDPVEGEQYAAHLTCFVGDGDEHYPGDFIALNAPDLPSYQIPDDYKLWDGITVESIRAPSGQYFSNNANSPNNVWNGQSTGLTANGIDIDSFNVTWDWAFDHGLEPYETSAKISLGNASSSPGDAELIMVVYVIISFRSETTTGGTLSYLVS